MQNKKIKKGCGWGGTGGLRKKQEVGKTWPGEV